MPSGGAGHASRRVATDFGATSESPQGSYADNLIRPRPTESRARRAISARRAMAMRRIGSLLLAMLAIGGGYTLAQAQEPSDLTKLTLEELMKIDVVSTNVLATHIHFAGQWMVAYEYMLEDMDGNRDAPSESRSDSSAVRHRPDEHERGNAHGDGHVRADRRRDARRDVTVPS